MRVWSISSGNIAVSLHVVSHGNDCLGASVLASVQQILQEIHDFEFMAVQVENESDASQCRCKQ